ncbi:MAG: hypothetical protein ACE5IR_24905, partial [bacterium]
TLIFSACKKKDPVSPEEQVAEESVKEIAAVATICEVTPGVQSLVDSVLIIRDQIHSLTIESDDPQVDGAQTALINVMVDLRTGTVTGWGTFRIEPKEVNGTWEGSFIVESIGGAPITGHSLGHGTGDLTGQKIFLDMLEILAGSVTPCDIVVPLPGAPKTQTDISGFIKQ